MDDMHNQHETPTGNAGAKIGHYLTATLAAADASVRLLTWLRRRSGSQEQPGQLEPGDLEQAGKLLDPKRQAYDAMLGPDAGRGADSRTALMAWVSAQPHREDDPQADLVASRAEVRLRELHPDAMGRYDALRAGLSPVEAMREVAPLIVVEQDRTSAREVYASMLDRTTAAAADSKQALATWTAALPLAETLPDAAQAATAAEARLRELHPDAMSRFDELRATQAPDAALAEIAPLIDPAGTPSARDARQPTAAAAGQGAPEVRYAPAVRDVLGAQAATQVLRDDAWPALAGALQQAEHLGAQPADLLRQVAGERELGSAKSVAEVLHFRVEQRTPNAADVASSSYPTPVAAAAAPARPAIDPFEPAAAGGLQDSNARRSAADPAALGAALELGRVADAERQAAQASAATPDDVSTPRVDERRDGLGQATVHTDRAAADQSTATALLSQTETRQPATTSAASTTSAPATASQSYPMPIGEVSLAQAAPRPAAAAAPAARAAVNAAPTTGRRR
jgi:hypothetical protein